MEEVGELGTAGSLGLGLCALLTGAKKYYALEIEVLYDIPRNLALLDELIDLFKRNAPLSAEFSQINIPITDYSYPVQLVEPRYLDGEYVKCLRNELQLLPYGKTEHIFIISDWSKLDSVKFGFIFSRAVMEHVKCPTEIYSGIWNYLKNGGVMVHDIELHSHGITSNPIGHLKINSVLWKIIQGNRAYSLNRFTLQNHIEAIEKKFTIIDIRKNYKKFQDTDEHYLAGATILARKIYPKVLFNNPKGSLAKGVDGTEV
jgi:hypothetical protein